MWVGEEYTFCTFGMHLLPRNVHLLVIMGLGISPNWEVPNINMTVPTQTQNKLKQVEVYLGTGKIPWKSWLRRCYIRHTDGIFLS